MFFLRKSTLEPLRVSMSSVRMGERALQIEIDEPSISGAIAAKAGLSGHAAMAVGDEARAARARRAAEEAGVLVDLHVAPLHTLPFAGEAFDVIVVHGGTGWVGTLDAEARQAVLREWHRVLRVGGRAVVIEPGTRRGLTAWFRPRRIDDAYESAGGTATALETAGFRAARLLADREGYRFTEGLRG
jgi:ubiquinone/menaquinone biosynthesis C-methylase UbiE